MLDLPGGDMFACMGNTYGKLFIVSRDKDPAKDKKILWSAISEKWNSRTKKWANEGDYRASIITRKELEHFIWGEPLKK